MSTTTENRLMVGLMGITCGTGALAVYKTIDCLISLLRILDVISELTVYSSVGTVYVTTALFFVSFNYNSFFNISIWGNF